MCASKCIFYVHYVHYVNVRIFIYASSCSAASVIFFFFLSTAHNHFLMHNRARVLISLSAQIYYDSNAKFVYISERESRLEALLPSKNEKTY